MDVGEVRERGAASPGQATPFADYPQNAVEWTVGRGRARVLELSAGSGELTAELCRLGHDVVATDPSPQVARRLTAHLPEARVTVARADDIPLAPSSVELVVMGSAYHSIDAARVLAEVARVLGRAGVLALIWNRGDQKIPWVRKMFALTGDESSMGDDDPFEASELFTATDHRSFRQWQRFERQTLVDFVATSAKAASLGPADRADLLAEAGALYDGYGRGPDGLLMPWVVECYRARVKGAAHVVPAAPTDDGLLIDFS